MIDEIFVSVYRISKGIYEVRYNNFIIRTLSSFQDLKGYLRWLRDENSTLFVYFDLIGFSNTERKEINL